MSLVRRAREGRFVEVESFPDENGKPPWKTALYVAVQAAEQRATELEADKAQLLLENHTLRNALRECRGRLENWKIRQETWRRERDELLRRLRARP